jgi:broad specificity phosphatase PhoE
VPNLYLVRHGKPLARYDQDLDPGLDPVGHEQARAAALELRHLAPLALVTSPLRRARETAAAFENRFHVTGRVEPAVGEVKSPTDDLAERTAWLREILRRQRGWSELDDERRRWRDGVLDALLAITSDTVVTTHYIAINAAVGAATGDDRVISFRPDFCSCTVLESDRSALQLIELGRQAETTVK